MRQFDKKAMHQLFNTQEKIAVFGTMDEVKQACEKGNLKSFKITCTNNVVQHVGEATLKDNNEVQVFIANGLKISNGQGIVLRDSNGNFL